MTNEEQQAKTMTPGQKAQYESIIKDYRWNENGKTLPDTLMELMHTVYNQQQAEIDRLQATVTDYAGKLLEQEEKFDRIAENEAKRCIEFGEVILKQADTEIMDTRVIATKSNSHSGDYAENLLYTLQTNICEIDSYLGYDIGAAITEKMAFNLIRKDHKIENRLLDNGKKF